MRQTSSLGRRYEMTSLSHDHEPAQTEGIDGGVGRRHRIGQADETTVHTRHNSIQPSLDPSQRSCLWRS